MTKTTDAMREWLSHYYDGCQNNERFKTNSVYTHGNGNGVRGLKTCRARGLIGSYPDDRINRGGYRHDLTAKGREVVDAMQVEHDERMAQWKREKEAAWRQSLELGIFLEDYSEPWHGSALVPSAD